MAFEDKMKNLNIKDSSKKLNKTLTLPLFEMPAPISYKDMYFFLKQFLRGFSYDTRRKKSIGVRSRLFAGHGICPITLGIPSIEES